MLSIDTAYSKRETGVPLAGLSTRSTLRTDGLRFVTLTKSA
jgi:hypothetical protein